MTAILDFLYCTGAGIGAVLLFIACAACIIGIPIFAVSWVWSRLERTSPRMRKLTTDTLPKVAILLFLCAAAILAVLGMHDMGCDIRKHPEHKILDKDKPSPALHREHIS